MKLHISCPDGEAATSKITLVPTKGKPVVLPASAVSFRLAGGEIAVAAVEFHSPTIEAKADAELVDIVCSILDAVSPEKASAIVSGVNLRFLGEAKLFARAPMAVIDAFNNLSPEGQQQIREYAKIVVDRVEVLEGFKGLSLDDQSGVMQDIQQLPAWKPHIVVGFPDTRAADAGAEYVRENAGKFLPAGGIEMLQWGSDSPPPAGAPFWRDTEPGEGQPNRPPDGHVSHGGTAAEFSQGNPVVAIREWAKKYEYSIDDHDFRRAARLVEGRLVEFASGDDLDIAAVCRKLVVFGIAVIVDQLNRVIRILFSLVDAPPAGDTPDVNPVAAVRHYCKATGVGYTIDDESFDEAERDVGNEMKRRNIRGVAPITSKHELEAVGRMLSQEFGYTAFRDDATASFRLTKNPAE